MSETIPVYEVDYQEKFDTALEFLVTQAAEYQQIFQDRTRLLASERDSPFNHILEGVDLDKPVEEQPEAVILGAAAKMFHQAKLARLSERIMEFENYVYTGRHVDAIKPFVGKWVKVVPIDGDSNAGRITKVRFNQFATTEKYPNGITGKILGLSFDPSRGGSMHLKKGVKTYYEVSHLVDVLDEGKPLHKVTFL